MTGLILSPEIFLTSEQLRRFKAAFIYIAYILSKKKVYLWTAQQLNKRIKVWLYQILPKLYYFIGKKQQIIV